jgi:anti-sigma regulatory factor (Ser/Thr protein kinase)
LRADLRTLDEVDDVAVLVSRAYPNPDRVALGVRELLLNAVEHGNAGITYDEKTALRRLGRWQDEVVRRLALPEHRDKRVRVELVRTADSIVLTITDEGVGFDWQRHLDFDPVRLMDSHGRGIALSRLTSFDQVEYVAPGNRVICKTQLAMS